jgi:hypothetical protein
MSMQSSLYKLTMVGALVGCARAMDEYGGAPLVDNGELHMNQRITVVGEVDEVRGDQIFTLINNDLTGGERLLVVATHPLYQITMGGATVFRGERLQIYGMVRRLSVSAMERALGFDLDPDLAVRYDARPIVVTAWISPPRMRSVATAAGR